MAGKMRLVLRRERDIPGDHLVLGELFARGLVAARSEFPFRRPSQITVAGYRPEAILPGRAGVPGLAAAPVQPFAGAEPLPARVDNQRPGPRAFLPFQHFADELLQVPLAFGEIAGERAEVAELKLQSLQEPIGEIGGPRRLSAESERSEERRVGKECRSRWSPYH